MERAPPLLHLLSTPPNNSVFWFDVGVDDGAVLGFPPTGNCSDGKRNGHETAIDCGGFNGMTACPPCDVGQACLVINDCITRICLKGKCAASLPAANCHDGIKNGAETDVDCGGVCCVCAVNSNSQGLWSCVLCVCCQLEYGCMPFH